MPEIKNIHILMMGRDPGHAKIGLQKLECDVVHIVTSAELAEEIDHKSMMEEWASDLGIKPGGIHTIPNSELFSAEATGKVVAAVLSIIRSEKSQNRPLDYLRNPADRRDDNTWEHKADEGWLTKVYIGFTGGTNLMSGAAVHAANLFGATPYYVARVPDGDPEDGEPILFPSMGATALLSTAPIGAIENLLDNPSGDHVALGRSDVEAGFLALELSWLNLATVEYRDDLDILDATFEYNVSEEGILLLGIFSERRGHTEPPAEEEVNLEDEVSPEEENDPTQDSKMGALAHTLITVTLENASNELLRVLMERWNLEGRAEVWELDGKLTLRTYFANTEDESSKPNLFRFKEETFEGDNDLLVKEIVSAIGYRWRRSEEELSRIISGDNQLELMTYLAKLKFEKMGFYIDPSSRSGSGWGRKGKKKP